MRRKVVPLTEAELRREAGLPPRRIRAQAQEVAPPAVESLELPPTVPPTVPPEVAALVAKGLGVALLAGASVLAGGGLVGGIRAVRHRLYNSARWLGNVQPFVALDPAAVVRRQVRRQFGRKLGRAFSWSRLLGL